MKVIKERKPLEDWNLEVLCSGKNWNQNGKIPCGSTLEIDVNDLIKRKWSKYPDNNGVDYGFICPVCQCFTEIDNKNLSEHLKNIAKDFGSVDSNKNIQYDKKEE